MNESKQTAAEFAVGIVLLVIGVPLACGVVALVFFGAIGLLDAFMSPRPW
jgi:hypothetical protein